MSTETTEQPEEGHEEEYTSNLNYIVNIHCDKIDTINIWQTGKPGELPPYAP